MFKNINVLASGLKHIHTPSLAQQPQQQTVYKLTKRFFKSDLTANCCLRAHGSKHGTFILQQTQQPKYHQILHKLLATNASTPVATARQHGKHAQHRALHSHSQQGVAASTRIRQAALQLPKQLYRQQQRGYIRDGHIQLSRRNYWNADTVLYSLVGVNIGVFFLWQYAPRFCMKHFTVSPDALLSGRVYTLLTAGVSQASIGHLFSNMIGLYFFGQTIGQVFGGKRLLQLYIVGALVGSLAHCGYYAYLAYQRARGSPSWTRVWKANTPACLGSSAAVETLITSFICFFPRQTILLYGIVPVPAALLGVLFLVNELTGIFGGQRSNISHAGHLGGAAVGVLYYLAVRLRRRP